MLNYTKDDFHPALSDNRDTWVFDLDNTLYAAECNLFDQVDQKISDFVQQFLGIEREEARKIQKRYLLDNGTTLNGLMTHHNVDPEEYLSFVHDIDFSPIERDEKLISAIQELEGRKLVFTNADKPYATNIMKRLGIHDLFEDIFGIVEGDLKPKPDMAVYEKFVKTYDFDPNKAVMFEDMVRNLKPAHQLGMGTVWINTGSVWGEADYDADIVHAETNNLATWLHAYLNR